MSKNLKLLPLILVSLILINACKVMGGGWIVLAEEKANAVDFPRDEDTYVRYPASAASYSEVEPVDQ